uniref:SNF-related serine/threonine-protein kinase n=1 Tax=Strigamia maritima TaxID=126957 RepID=T1IHI2_STRMM
MSKARNSSSYDGKIAGLYDLEDTLGRGHFAVVKLARHVFTGEKVAVKVIDKTKLDEVSRAHLFQEVRCMKLVQHPNVVRLYEVIDTQTKLYLILELGDGGDMYDYIMKHEKGLDEEAAKKYFRQIVHAISYCHKLHVVHRDLKPENVVFFEKLGMVKLTDFGFSNRFFPGQKLETSCGSLAYSAPEILLGDSYDAPAVDVWSLGVILYMLVCGRAPFQEANDSETLTMIMDCKYTIPPGVSTECKNLIAKMLVRDPEKRASLEVIAADPWLQQCETIIQPADYLPLVSKEHLSDEDHQLIIQKLVNGGIATKEEIIEALNKNSYNHITATYFLLAERKLRAHRQEQANLISQAADSTNLSALAISPRCSTNPTITCTQNSLSLVTNLISPLDDSHQLNPTSSSSISNTLDLPPCPYKGMRKCSVVEEEDEDACSEKSDRTGRGSICSVMEDSKCASSPSLAKDLKLELKEVMSGSASRSSSASSSPCPSPSRTYSPSSLASPTKIALLSGSVNRFKTLPSPNRKLHSVRSSPQLTLNEIYEECESDSEPASSLISGPSSAPHQIARSRVLHSHQSVASPPMLRSFDWRQQTFGKSRTASCSSSDASDDDADPHKRKAVSSGEKIKNIPKRDSHDDSSDSQDQGSSEGSGARSGGSSKTYTNQTHESRGPQNGRGDHSQQSNGNGNGGNSGRNRHSQTNEKHSKTTSLATASCRNNRVFCKSSSNPLNVLLNRGAGNPGESGPGSPLEGEPVDLSKVTLSEPSSPVLRPDENKDNKLQASLNLLNRTGSGDGKVKGDRIIVASSSRSSLGLGRILKRAPQFVSRRLDINQNGFKKKNKESRYNKGSGENNMMLVSHHSSTSKCCSLC